MQNGWRHVLVSSNTPNRIPISALLVANVISLIGSTLTTVAIPWFVLSTTGSASKAGLTGAFEFAPAFFAGILGGVVIDRIGPRIAAIIADLVSGISILMIPILYKTVGLAFWQLLILVLLASLLSIPGVTARRALLPELATLGNVRLDRVNAILEGNQHLAYFIGPPLAGILIANMGTSNVLWIDGASSLISVAALVLLVPTITRQSSGVVRSGLIAEIREGLVWLWNDSVVKWIAIALCVMNAFGSPFFSLIFAVYAKDRWDDPRYLGLMLSAFSVGLLVGTSLYGWKGVRLPRRWFVVTFLLLATISYWPLLRDTPFVLLIGLLILGGLSDGPVNPLLVSVRLERIPEAMRGRVFAATSAFAQLLPAAMIPLTGIAIQQIGLRPTILILAIGCLVAGVGMALNPVWKHLDDTRPA